MPTRMIQTTKPDISKLAEMLGTAKLQDCLDNQGCSCITDEEHEARVRRAKELGLTKSPKPAK